MESPLTADNTRMIDLSIPVESGSPSEPWTPEIKYWDHETCGDKLAENLRESGYGEDLSHENFPDGEGLAWEQITAIIHTGTHMDAPWHYGPKSEGAPSKTIDEIPADWCRGSAVVLDFTWKKPRTEITADEIDAQLEEIGHELSPGEIVLIETGADELWGSEDYLTEFPGMSTEATKHLVGQGIKVIGIDAYGFDKPFIEMGRRFAETGDNSELWPAHLAGREMEYCQIEKMANLDELPRRTDIPLVAMPIKVEDASAGWTRPIAFAKE
ncbi:cyclase family protein [Natrinema gelatinilyticum]|uniref:cyclase family protein n=1 Tax=Natrinema gelatinilyticum TaxID=2961571 RepID=UPI0020C3C400|nr:cyclase family protein [Natrinema gelatinilyticum]